MDPWQYMAYDSGFGKQMAIDVRWILLIFINVYWNVSALVFTARIDSSVGFSFQIWLVENIQSVTKPSLEIFPSLNILQCKIKVFECMVGLKLH